VKKHKNVKALLSKLLKELNLCDNWNFVTVKYGKTRLGTKELKNSEYKSGELGPISSTFYAHLFCTLVLCATFSSFISALLFLAPKYWQKIRM